MNSQYQGITRHSRKSAGLSGESNSVQHRRQLNRSAEFGGMGFEEGPLSALQGGRGRGLGATTPGKVRWAAPQIRPSAPLTLPSPPGRRGERRVKRVLESPV